MNLTELLQEDDFISRHIGTGEAEREQMLKDLGVDSLDALISAVIPDAIRLKEELRLPEAISEREALAAMRGIAAKNKLYRNYIGLGYYPTFMPPVILRNLLENPGWYTSYTPYQAEVSQGRLEALLNFQQMSIDLTGLPLAVASLLDEATAAAEAMAMCRRVGKNKTNAFFVDRRILPQTLDVLKTRAQYFGFDLVVADFSVLEEQDFFGAIFSYAGKEGDVLDLTETIAAAHQKGIVVAVAADIMSLVLLKSPGAMGADIAVGSTQRFGIPMSFGGPHAAYFTCKDEYKRQAPGRIIGVSVDADGAPALRMALQTREQHIRREKATSNICTAQALLANIAGMYAVYHGPARLKTIATRIHTLATLFADKVKQVSKLNVKVAHEVFFDTVCIEASSQFETILARAFSKKINLGLTPDNKILIAFSECSTVADFADLCEIFAIQDDALPEDCALRLPAGLLRRDPILIHPVFNSYHTEHGLLRYLKRLENKDISLTRSMISLGSCTMKLNAASEMLPMTWPEFTEIHPFAPRNQVEGYLELIADLGKKLKAITGFDGISFQPNSGAQGEYTGLVMIRRYFAAKKEPERKVCLIPRSAHGTNPASATMAGLDVVVVNCDAKGDVDVADLKEKAEQYAKTLAALMITYPSTHGVFEENISEIIEIIHRYGGQVYMDGANMNAQVGLIRPADIGADVLHMNLHKTFCIPHGGGGPGVGPVAFKKHLAPFAPSHVLVSIPGAKENMGAVSAAPYGSAGILPISWMYLTMMGRQGLPEATKNAILNANYVAKRLNPAFPVLYTGKKGFVGHECIIDCRPIKEEVGITEVDIAKRLIDYGFHAPTMSFPVPGTFMIEPTESESKSELDRFIAAMLQIKKEILEVKKKVWPLSDNPLVNAPHTAAYLLQGGSEAYTAETAAYPLAYLQHDKYWPPVRRLNEVYGDKHLICSCPPMEDYL